MGGNMNYQDLNSDYNLQLYIMKMQVDKKISKAAWFR